MSKRFLISESEITDIKKMHGILNEDNFLTDMVKKMFNSAAGGSTDSTNTENIIKNIFSGDKSSERLLEEIVGLREDLNSGKVAVYLDGKKMSNAQAITANRYTKSA